MAGNLVDYDGVTRTYNAANHMIHDGTNMLTYDNNGNLTAVGSDTYTWDRANRLLSVGNHSYVYDGLGNRVQQTVSSVVTDYLNDVQPGLTKLLKQDDGTNVDRFVHAPRGIHAVDDGTDWNFYANDGLGSVRAVVDDMAVVQSSMSYDPYGNPMASYGAGFGFTGEQTDENDNIYLRARYMNPNLGTFLSLDPWEGMPNRPMSLNGYSWVEGNSVMNVDPNGAAPSFYDLVASESDFSSALEPDAVNRTDPLPYGGRSRTPNGARERFVEFENYVRGDQLVNPYRCQSQNETGGFLTYGDLFAVLIGAEFGLLNNPTYFNAFESAVEALGRHYYEFTTLTGSSGGELQGNIDPTPGFQGTELWAFLGQIQGFYDRGQHTNQDLFRYMINADYRSYARDIMIGTVHGQTDIANGFVEYRGRPRNWGNSSVYGEPAATRLRNANANNVLTVDTSLQGVYYQQVAPDEDPYEFMIWAYYPPTEFVV